MGTANNYAASGSSNAHSGDYVVSTNNDYFGDTCPTATNEFPCSLKSSLSSSYTPHQSNGTNARCFQSTALKSGYSPLYSSGKCFESSCNTNTGKLAREARPIATPGSPACPGESSGLDQVSCAQRLAERPIVHVVSPVASGRIIVTIMGTAYTCNPQGMNFGPRAL